MRILFITSRKSAGAEVSYPLIRFRRELRKAGLDFEILHELPEPKKEKADAVIFCTPFWRDRFQTNGEFMKAADLMLARDFERGYKVANKVVFFETSDSTASAHLPRLQQVDMMLKWQILKDKQHYCTPEYQRKPCVWLEESHKQRPAARACDLHKLGIGWNLAYRNYSLFRRGARHLHWKGVTWNTRFTSVERNRPLLTFFRGGLAGSRQTHRGRAFCKLREMNRSDILLGEPVGRYRFIQEIRSAKATVSPFGYGEICFREMEAFIHGSIVVKPTMDHVDTFPNLYLPHETYMPVKWDFSDLVDVLERVSDCYSELAEIARNGQQAYKEFTLGADYFVNHLRNIMNRLFS